MHCPKCFSKMELTNFRGLKIDRCTGCQGLWFQPDELARLRKDHWMAEFVLDEGRPRVGREYNRVRDIACPECEAVMEQESDPGQPHIVYERCPNGHGIFLDAGELTDLLRNTFWDRLKPAG